MRILRARRLIRWPKDRHARAEAVALLFLAGLFLLALSGAVADARREYRDGLRRAELRRVKTDLERWFNDHHGFPLHPSGDLGWCGSTEDPEDWFFASKETNLLERPAADPLHRRGYSLRYCPTALRGTDDAPPPLASGFFLEARLENLQPDKHGLDTEYNILERTFTENDVSYYRVCGGTETQCGTSRDS